MVRMHALVLGIVAAVGSPLPASDIGRKPLDYAGHPTPLKDMTGVEVELAAEDVRRVLSKGRLEVDASFTMVNHGGDVGFDEGFLDEALMAARHHPADPKAKDLIRAYRGFVGRILAGELFIDLRERTVPAKAPTAEQRRSLEAKLAEADRLLAPSAIFGNGRHDRGTQTVYRILF